MINDGTRLALAFFSAWALSLALGWYLIPMLRRLKVGQSIRAEGPQTHLAKTGTPTMGGLIFALPAVLVVLLLAPRQSPGWIAVLAAAAVALGHGAIGFADDYIKVVLRRSLGLRARTKLFYELLLGLGLAFVADRVLGLGTSVQVPWLGTWIQLGWVYYPLVVLVVFSAANAVNLTDGVDGLVGGATVIVFGFYTFVCLRLGQLELAVLSVAVLAAAAGFLRYNAYPARVFMGDTGSLFLGGALAAVAVLTRTELVLPVAGLLFTLETTSVILQVLSFRLTGRRIFRMSPLHHHFELLGWRETMVVRRFWLICLVGVALAWWGLGPAFQR